MMTKTEIGVYSVFDKVSGNWSPLQMHDNDNVARRAFTQATRDMHKDDKLDYVLKYLGTFNMVTGKLSSEDEPKIIMDWRAID
jgi:hypothetical protein